jgi:hypothetical protein
MGGPGTFVQTAVGPYNVLLSANPPASVPGPLELDLRLTAADSSARLLRATAVLDDGDTIPVRILSDGSAIASIWVTSTSAHVLHLALQGSRGAGSTSLLLPAIVEANPSALPRQLRPALLLGSGILLLAALASLYRSRKRPPSASGKNIAAGPAPHWTMSRVAVSLFVASFALASITIASYAVRPRTELHATLLPGGRLNVTLSNPEDTFTDLVLDDGKPLHLFLVRKPGDDVLLHLHPQRLAGDPGDPASLHTAAFTTQLPTIPPGRYTLYADFAHRPSDLNQAPRSETAVLTLDLPAQSAPASSIGPDDSFATLPSLSQAQAAAQARAALQTQAALPTMAVAEAGVPFLPQPAGHVDVPFTASPHPIAAHTAAPAQPSPFALDSDVLPDGYTLQLRTPAKLTSRRASLLEVTLLAPTGQPPSDMRLYLGMAAHAFILRTGSLRSATAGTAEDTLSDKDEVFAHVHPGGTLPAASPAAAATETPETKMPASKLPASKLPASKLPASNTATIPYGFPSSGRYRVFIQMKHGHTVETAAFDLTVS